MSAEDAPLIVSAALDAPLQDRLDALRREHFPPERLVVGAHLTLFHALPGDQLEAVLAACRELAAQQQGGPLPARATEPMPLGRGVAIRIEAPGLKELHRALQERFADVLTPQDRQGLHAHVTVQNKVEPAAAKALLAQLREVFEPQDGQVEALAVWRYHGGPWEPAGRAEL